MILSRANPRWNASRSVYEMVTFGRSIERPFLLTMCTGFYYASVSTAAGIAVPSGLPLELLMGLLLELLSEPPSESF